MFGDAPEDPWVQVIEIPLRHKESGESFTFTAQSKTSWPLRRTSLPSVAVCPMPLSPSCG